MTFKEKQALLNQLIPFEKWLQERADDLYPSSRFDCTKYSMCSDVMPIRKAILTLAEKVSARIERIEGS